MKSTQNVILKSEQKESHRFNIKYAGENSMRKFLVITMIVFIPPSAWATSYPLPVPPPVLEEFISVEAVKFRDVQGTNNSPAIPKSWKLISVSNGEKSNSNNLWFQDTNGSVYLLQGFTSQNKFILHDSIYRIPAK
jgi:hypothetical protein